ncbi:DEBR0S1_34288g1_1 [Brettanomyces bruxellensis]|uniref:DEBR0S1_34288g1_1 n=1 Tax=Dekkera bruxellensis TaxID=5007 RepID=A0A7D9H087_DEKBR|nr:DEBR0S1_34288g1_1 [Brettanomyces bruxellensis]
MKTSEEFRQQFMPDLDLNGAQFSSECDNLTRRSVSNNSDSSATSTIINTNGERERAIFSEIMGLRTSHYSNLVPLEASGLGQPAMLPHFQQSLPETNIINPPSSFFGSPSGIFDNSSNLGEFQNLTQPPANLSGGQFSIPGSFESDVKSEKGQNRLDSTFGLQSLDEINEPMHKKRRMIMDNSADNIARSTTDEKNFSINKSTLSPKEILFEGKHKLLTLKLTNEKQDKYLVDSSGNIVDFRVAGSLFGGFSYEGTGAGKENFAKIPIICYRRNYIILDICLGASECPKFVLFKDGSKKELRSIKVEIQAKSRVSKNGIPLVLFDPMISHNSKFGKVPKTIISVPHAMVQPFKGRHMIIFNRFQFKSATPTNRKKTPVNYFYISVKLHLVISCDGVSKGIAYGEMRSNDISVRGRSPTFYNKRYDISILKEVSDFSWDSLHCIPLVEHGKMQLHKREKDASGVNVTCIGMSTSNKCDNKKLRAKYKYIPISSSYYLPPIRPYYLPHSAAHREGKNDHLNMREFANASKYNFFIKKTSDPVV